MTTSQGKLFSAHLPIIACACILAAGPRSAWAQSVPEGAPDQPVDRMYSAEIKEGQVGKRSESELPASARKRSGEDPPKPVEPQPAAKLRKIGDRLSRDLASAARAPGKVDRARVIVTFVPRGKLPRFPEPTEREVRGSPDNTRSLSRAQEMIAQVERARSAIYDNRASEFERTLGAREVDRFWLIDAMVLDIPLAAVEALAARPDVQFVEYDETLDEPPHASDQISVGRAVINSDPYFGFTGAWIGLLDTGILHTHTSLSSPNRYAFRRDCTGTSSTCSGGDPVDDCWNHGTSTASILSGNSNLGASTRGVTNILVDSWKVYPAGCGGYSNSAGVRAFQRAVAVLDRVIVAEIQSSQSETGSTAAAADAAFDAGSVVVAAAGNFGSSSGSVRSPGNAHKALAIGAVDVQSLALQSYSGRGPTGDGRIKPDLLAPTNSHAASTTSTTAQQIFGGTSGATPYGAGAAALARNFLRGSSSVVDPGQVYAFMIMSGEDSSPDNNNGAGLIDMPVNGNAFWGAVNVGNQMNVDIPISISPGVEIDAAIWWPESTSTHNDVDLYLIRPDGTTADLSLAIGSVFEKVFSGSNPPNGTWTLRVRGYSVSGTQKVYYALHSR